MPKPKIEDIKTTVQVGVEVTVLRDYTVEVDKSDPKWRERAVQEAERRACSEHVEVVSARGEITDE
jgi:hypothetical protein